MSVGVFLLAHSQRILLKQKIAGVHSDGESNHLIETSCQNMPALRNSTFGIWYHDNRTSIKKGVTKGSNGY